MSETNAQGEGKWRYILTRGVVGWGAPFFLLMLIWDRIEDGAWPAPMGIASLACISVFGGFVLGNWIWKDHVKGGG